METTISSSFSPNFVKLYDDLLKSRKISPSETLVFEIIKSFADKNLVSCISYGKIRQITGLSKTTIVNSIKVLRKKGVLSVQTRIADDGSYLPNRYILHDFDVIWENDNNTNLENLILNHNNLYFTDINDFNINKNRHFICVPFDLIKTGISVCAKHVYLFLLKHLNGKTGECYPSVKRLAKESGYCIITVRKAIKELENAGLIKKISRFLSGDLGGRQTSNQYNILNVFKPTKTKETSAASKNDLSEQPKNIHSRPEEMEEWTLDKIRDYYEFDILENECKDRKLNKSLIPAVAGALHEVLNTGKDRKIFINGSSISSETVKEVYKSLTWQELIYVINNYSHVTHKITNQMSYIKTMLYRAKYQLDADVINQVNTDFPQFN